MKLDTFLISLTLIAVLEVVSVDGRFMCFRRLKKRGKCGGYLRRGRYSSAQECCAGRGQGFADKKVKLGRNRFKCTPCSELVSESEPQFGAGVLDLFPESTDALTSTTTTTSTTTEFFWPAPARSDYAIAPNYPPPKDEDGELIIWEPWSPCSVSCGAGWRSRAKKCDNCDRNDYENVQSQPCMVNFYCPVDGNWGPWYPWESCSSTCSGGTRTRQRKCNYPRPANGGADCPGDAVALQECNRKPCPVDGNWGEWSPYSECSTTCGPGIARSTRRCDSPEPENGGRSCQGPDISTKKCDESKCPVDGSWSLWGTWTLCSASCGPGIMERSRTCDSPRPQHGGKECEGPATHQEECYAGRPCPVDGGWTAWTNYGYCRAPRCGRGYQIRSRTCSNPEPALGGKNCVGQQYERVGCYNDQDCPVNGTWCEWSAWNACSSSCKETSSLQGRQRICACPPPKNEGTRCQGESFQVQKCTDLPYCNTPDPFEKAEASGDGANYDEEGEADSNSKSSITSTSNIDENTTNRSSSSSNYNNEGTSNNNNNRQMREEDTSSSST